MVPEMKRPADRPILFAFFTTILTLTLSYTLDWYDQNGFSYSGICDGTGWFGDAHQTSFFICLLDKMGSKPLTFTVVFAGITSIVLVLLFISSFFPTRQSEVVVSKISEAVPQKKGIQIWVLVLIFFGILIVRNCSHNILHR